MAFVDRLSLASFSITMQTLPSLASIAPAVCVRRLAADDVVTPLRRPRSGSEM
jgi:hypothetical protein